MSKLRSPLAGLRFHDLRHQAITEMSESGKASEQTIMAIAGHVSRKMLERYSHARMEAKRAAVALLGGRLSSHVTVDVTIDASEGKESSQVVENIGGRHGIRTRDLLVANEALSQLS